MLRIEKETTNQIMIEKSKFITYASPIQNEVEAKEYILKIKKLHPNASHHCYAFVCGENNDIKRSNDDGEPSGTAGSPMLESLYLSNIHDCVCVCVRYFGGIKLGAGGLIRAYSTCCSEVLKLTNKLESYKVLEYIMTFPYELVGKIDYLLQNKNAIILNKNYDVDIDYQILIDDDSFLLAIQEISSNNVVPKFIGYKTIDKLL